MSSWRIPLSDLNYGEEEEQAVQRVLRSKWLSMGPEVEAFEREFAEFIGVKYAFAVANATAALHLSLLGLGIGEDDEVIQPALNFVAAANCTIAVGATPVFADILSLDEPTIDPSQVEKLITERTKAVLVMHYAGYLCRMADLEHLCQRHGILLIEDACHAIGASYGKGISTTGAVRMAGSIGDVGAFSFFSNKNLATGEGGMITTNRDDLANAIRALRSHGMTTLTWDRERGHASSYDVRMHGYNFRLDEIHAALGREQLRKLEAGNQVRARCVATYRARLGVRPECIIPFANYEGESAFHLMPVVFARSSIRDRVVDRLKSTRIQSSLHYPCITDFTAFKMSSEAGVPHTRRFAGSVATLPLFSTMREEQVNEVCATLKEALKDGL